MNRCHVQAILVLTGVTLAVAAAGQALAQAVAAERTKQLDTSGHVRAKLLAGAYGGYVAIALPIALEADDAAAYALSLTFIPLSSFALTSEMVSDMSLSRGDVMTASALTWFGAMQGHLWAAVGDADGFESARAGLLSSALGLGVGVGLAKSRDLSAGHAAAIGGGHWWGTAYGYLAANRIEDAPGADVARAAAIGSATGFVAGAVGGSSLTLKRVRYMHLGGLVGWLYSSGLSVVVDANSRQASYTQMAGITAGATTALLLTGRGDAEPVVGAWDHSGRLRLQAFSALYGAYLATLIPRAAGVENNDENKDTYALLYMHVPTGALLGTTWLTRHRAVPRHSAIAISSLTWFGALQGALWGDRGDGSDERTATASLIGSAVGLGMGSAVAAAGSMSEGHAGMLGVGNWWGALLGTYIGAMPEDAESDGVLTSAAIGSATGVAVVAMGLGRDWELSRAHSTHVGGLVGTLTGLGILIGVRPSTSSSAFGILSVATGAGLAFGALNSDVGESAKDKLSSAQPILNWQKDPEGKRRAIVGLSYQF